MGNRKLAISDDEDETPTPVRRRLRKQNDEHETQRTRKKLKLRDEEEDGEMEEEEEEEEEEEPEEREEVSDDDDDDKSKEDEDVQEDAKPVGEIVRVTGKGRGRREHYEAFDLDGTQYDLEDPVLLVPEDQKQKPYVAIIKDISQTKDGSLMVSGQWFYRPEEAEKKGGGNWQSKDVRELFYSFHRDEVPAESVMHKCVVHFIPLHKQLPKRKEHPGFIVQRVYDTVNKKLWKLTDKDYEDGLQHEIDLLVQKTLSRLVDLPDIETEEAAADGEDPKNKRTFRNKNISPIDVSKEDGPSPKAETPVSCRSNANASEHYRILEKFKALTGETHRDKYLEKLLHGVQFVFTSGDNMDKDEKVKSGSDGVNGSDDCKENSVKDIGSLVWPDDAVPAITALEKAADETLFSLDFTKYNQKMRQLVFNLGNNAALTRRLVSGELEPLKVLNMSPTELKEGLTAEELAAKQPEETRHMQMTDARCRQCNEKKVGVLDVVQTGHGDRYQLECIPCGHTWYASRDAVSTLTVDDVPSVAPSATAEVEDVEKTPQSPRESENSTADAPQKPTEADVPFLEQQSSFNKSKTDESPTSGKNAE